MEAIVEVLTNPTCPHCLRALDRVAALAEEAGVPVAGIDVYHHPEIAHDRGDWESSIVVSYGSARFAGVPNKSQFEAMLRRGRAKGI